MVVTGAGVWYSCFVVVTSVDNALAVDVVASEVDSVDGSTRATVVSGGGDVICDNVDVADDVGEIVDDDDDDDDVSKTDVVVVVIVIVVGTVDVNDINVVYSNGNVFSVVVEVVVDNGFGDLVGLVVRRGGLVVRRQYLVVSTGPREVVIRVVDFFGGLYRVVKMM